MLRRIKLCEENIAELCVAVLGKKADIVQQKISDGTDFAVEFDGGKTVLHIAAECDAAEIIPILVLKAAMETRKRDDEGNTPLDRAIREEKVSAVRALMQYADYLPSGESSPSSAQLAIFLGNPAVIGAFLESKGFNIFYITPRDQKTLLEYAFDHGSDDVVKQILTGYRARLTLWAASKKEADRSKVDLCKELIAIKRPALLSHWQTIFPEVDRVMPAASIAR